MTRYTNDQVHALNYFADAYLNTGCDEDDAADFAVAMLNRFEGDAEALRFEAERYRDM